MSRVRIISGGLEMRHCFKFPTCKVFETLGSITELGKREQKPMLSGDCPICQGMWWNVRLPLLFPPWWFQTEFPCLTTTKSYKILLASHSRAWSVSHPDKGLTQLLWPPILSLLELWLIHFFLLSLVSLTCLTLWLLYLNLLFFFFW